MGKVKSGVALHNSAFRKGRQSSLIRMYTHYVGQLVLLKISDYLCSPVAYLHNFENLTKK